MGMDTGTIVTAVLASAGLGFVVGLERQVAQKHATSGARTFALYGLWGTAAGVFGDEFGGAGFAAAAIVFGGLVVVSYAIDAARRGHRGTTTEAAALATFASGYLVWQDQVVAAVAIAVGVGALLRAKDEIRALIGRLTEEDTRAFLQFAVLTAVVLPLAPDEEFGPFDAFNPREIWLMVVFVAGIGLVGYLALRLVGARGLSITGAIGGLVSSTAVALGFSRMSKGDAGLRTALAAGILGASAVMYPRVYIEAVVVEPALAERLLVPLAALFVAVALGAVWWAVRPASAVPADLAVRNPLTLTVAITFGALYAVIVFVSKALLDRASEASLSIVGAVSGINDVDAITLSTANLVGDGLDPVVGARVVIAAVAVNTLVKGLIVVMLGSRRLAASVGMVLAPAAAMGGVFWFVA